jgi:hypothetical protein
MNCNDILRRYHFPPTLSPSDPSVSFSSARMSARTSSSLRSGCGEEGSFA